LQSAVKEALMRAYFLDGVDLTRRDNLIDIASSAGMERTMAERALDDPARVQAVADDEQRARAMRVEGVPFFVFDDRVAVSGAQGTPILLDAMRQAA
jgi:predicted DsbA family dithiol-disulfide isomerase